ncbi:hypothetical protein BST46_26335 [Mycobacterium timonense]|uniref:TetR family transcriptional regulator n=1 Tax=Mycobacterium timonense TaxID=701043 RepID=A0ABX3TE86_9MYCO|nr:hypothetical protein BST46_26335 [Mycobacterium timonense]
MCRENGVDELHVEQLVDVMRHAHIQALRQAWSDAAAAGRTRGRGLSMRVVLLGGENGPWEIAAEAAQAAALHYLRQLRST